MAGEDGAAVRAAAGFGRAALAWFALDAGATFLNNGSYGAPPRVVLEAQARWRARMEAQPVRFFQDEYPPALAAAKARLAAFLGAAPGDLAFVENATAGANAVLRSLRFGPGDELLTTTHCYGAVFQTLRHVAATTGATLVAAPTPWPARAAGPIADAVIGAMGPRTRLLAIDHVASASALVFPLAPIVAAARARGIKVLVDGAHVPGQLPLDVPAVGAEWYVGNCHKWLFAPKGSGFLWAAPGAREGLHPPVISHDYGKGFPAEFEWVGTRDPSAWLVVGEGIDFLDRLGPGQLRGRNHALATEAGAMLARAWGTEIGAAPDLFASMATVRLPGRHAVSRESAFALRARLWREHAIEVPVMPFADALWIRVSAQVFNETADYERLAAAVAASA